MIKNPFIVLLFLASAFQTLIFDPVNDACAENQAEKGEIHFRMAFGALSAGTSILEPVDQNTPLKTGDKLKLFLDIRNKCHIYVIYRSSQDEILLLFPPQLETDHFSAPRRYYIPENDLWFALDAVTGRETFYVLASSVRLNALESLYTTYSAATDPETKRKRSEDLLSEIHSLRAGHKILTAAAERPTRLGGSIRGLQKVQIEAFNMLSDMADEIHASEFYSRVFSIDHR